MKNEKKRRIQQILRKIWNGYSMDGNLTTTGARILILLFFPGAEKGYKYSPKNFTGPVANFWDLDQDLQNQIEAMLETSWMGRAFIDGVYEKLSEVNNE